MRGVKLTPLCSKIAFLFFANFSEVPIENRLLYANRHLPLTPAFPFRPYPPPPAPIHAAPIGPEKRKKITAPDSTGAAFTYASLVCQSKFAPARKAARE